MTKDIRNELENKMSPKTKIQSKNSVFYQEKPTTRQNILPTIAFKITVSTVFFFSILNIYTCKHKIYNHQSYIYLICLGMKKMIIIKIKIKIFKKLKL